jgi:hypothetical protein
MTNNRLTGRSNPNAQRLVAALGSTATPATTAGPVASPPPSSRHVDNTLGTTASGNNALWGIDGQGNSVLRPSYQFGLGADGGVTQTEISPTYNNGNHFAGTGRTAFDRNSVPMSDQGYAALQGANLPIATDRDVLGGGAFGARAWANQHPGGVIGAFGAAALGGALAAGYGGAAGGAGAGAGSGAGAGTGAAAGTGATAGTAGTAAGTAGTAAGTAGAVGAPAGIEGVTVLGSSGAGAGAGAAAGAGAGIGGSAAFWDSVNQGASNTSATNAQNEHDLQNMQAPTTARDWASILSRSARAAGLLNSSGLGGGGGGGSSGTPGPGIQRNTPNPVVSPGTPLPTGAPVPTNPATAWNAQTFGGGGGVGFRPTAQQNLQPIASRPYAAQGNAPVGTDGYFV